MVSITKDCLHTLLFLYCIDHSGCLKCRVYLRDILVSLPYDFCEMRRSALMSNGVKILLSFLRNTLFHTENVAVNLYFESM